ncbi:AMP-dependent synthetase [Nitrososphaera sp. AFS]|nr:AMP-dependent synthetase [Nitrososphaera sp. AFS]
MGMDHGSLKCDNINGSNILQFMKKHQIATYQQLLQKSVENIAWYWNAVNEDLGFEWYNHYTQVFDSSEGFPRTKWFLNGKCNIVYNAVDKHARNHPDKIAYIFENERGISKTISYDQLASEVNSLATALKHAGVKKGDTVGIYMPMIPEAFFSMFACSKIGAVHATVFSGFGGQALCSRLRDCNAQILITADTMQRKSQNIDLKERWTKALEGTSVLKIITVGRTDSYNGREIISYSEFIKDYLGISCDTEIMDSEDPLFILYTSGTTGKPKGTVQVHGGYMIVSGQQTSYLIDMKPQDVLFWYADIGWITGQTCVVYGSSLIGGTALVYDGHLDYPDVDTWCKIIQKYKVTIFGMAPTAIRNFMREKTSLDNYDFSTLRILATTGEPINKEAWLWYFENIGKKRCPIINLSGGTEIGGALLSASPIISLKPCTVGFPVPGFDVDVLDNAGRRTRRGFLIVRRPWPSMSRGILENWNRFIETYWSKYGNEVWYHGDIVFVDPADGLWYILGRADDIIKTSGHRIESTEIECAITSHSAVSEVAVIGIPDKIKGEYVTAYVVLKKSFCKPKIKVLKNEIVKIVEDSVGRFACPKNIIFVEDLPRTRTGKLVRRIIKAKVLREKIGSQDLSTIENPESLKYIVPF